MALGARKPSAVNHRRFQFRSQSARYEHKRYTETDRLVQKSKLTFLAISIVPCRFKHIICTSAVSEGATMRNLFLPPVSSHGGVC